MVLYKEIRGVVSNAMKQFGEYTYYDKGPDEVIDIEELLDVIKKYSIEDQVLALKEVERQEWGESLLSSLFIEDGEWCETIDNEDHDLVHSNY